jgi:hypothetical protein
MGQNPQRQQFAPSETLASLNLGYNGYTDPTLTNPRQWVAATNCFSGAFGFVQRCRFANVITSTTTGFTPLSLPFTSLKFVALPGLSNYLLGDIDGKQYSFDSGLSYAATLRPQLLPFLPSGSYSGPWSREFLQNAIYEMNGTIKQTGRGANLATVQEWGIDAPDTSPQVTLFNGNSQTIIFIQRTNGTVTVSLSGALTVPGGNGVGMVNVAGVTDTSFNGTFVVATGAGTTMLTWAQAGQNSTDSTGTVNTNITKSVGRSYAWAWENANDTHISAPSPSTQYIKYTAQNGAIDLIEQGTVVVTGTAVVGTGTAFTSAWLGRKLWVDGTGAMSQIVAVADATHMTLSSGALSGSGVFVVYDPQVTAVRLYATSDGGATYFRVQRNLFLPAQTGLVAAGLRFFDNAQAEPPNFPFTTETSQLYNVPPPIGAFVKEFQGRLLVYGVPELGQTFFYSNNELTNFGLPQESYAPLNQVTLPIQNASINGMAEFPGSLIIWSDKQDMFRLTGLLADNSVATATQQGAQISALPYNLGCASPFSVALTPLGAIWLTSNKEVWLYTDRYAPRNIGRPVQDILANIPAASLGLARGAYYHTENRNWYVLAIPNGATNNVLLVLDLDLLAANGSPSYFVFDMATNQPAWFVFNLPCTWVESMYESGGAVRLFSTGINDTVQDVDYMTGLLGTELPVTGAGFTTHAWGNESAPSLKRPQWFRYQTNREPEQLALDGWTFQAQGIDDDVYTFRFPLRLNCTPGGNDCSTLGGNPNLAKGEPFRHSPELYRVGGVNFVMGRRLRFQINFPSTVGIDFQFRSIQIGFGPVPPR